jgi:hypothetical protein
MRRHQALLDTAARVVHLDSSEHGSVTLHLTSTPVPDASTHQKCNLVIEPISAPYMISTSGGQIVTNQVVVNPPLNLKGRIYKTCLIILDGQVIDVILGMSRMRRHRALLDTDARVVHLDSPEHGSVTLQLASTPVPDASTHHTVAQNLEDIPVACEFSDIFPEDLPSISLDRDVEFTI